MEWEAIVAKQAKSTKKAHASVAEKDDSMFQYGGIIGNNETNAIEAQAICSKMELIIKDASNTYVEYLFFFLLAVTNNF